MKKRKPTKPRVACAKLAGRIPFSMLSHMSAADGYSGRYTNETLGIGYEYHTPSDIFHSDPASERKSTQWFYRENPKDSPLYPSLTDLLAEDDELRARAEAAYPPT